MKISEMNKEELLAAREMHVKSGASLKVEMIDEMLANIKLDPQLAKVCQEDKEDWEDDIEAPVVVDAVEAAYELKTTTDLSWTEIAKRVGLKKPQGIWSKVKKYADDNDLPYEG